VLTAHEFHINCYEFHDMTLTTFRFCSQFYFETSVHLYFDLMYM